MHRKGHCRRLTPIGDLHSTKEDADKEDCQSCYIWREEALQDPRWEEADKDGDKCTDHDCSQIASICIIP